MADGTAEVSIAANADDVWKVVGDFGGLAGWMPGMESCDVDGDVRTIKTMGIEIEEQLRERDDADRRIAYGIVQSPMGLEHHHATIWIDADGDGSRVFWSVDVRPDEMLGAFLPIYESSLQALKSHFEH
ncbi:MAG: SRPBCC family protein [Actinomycetota bacterium]